MFSKYALSLFLFMSFFYACKKDSVEFNAIPEIELVSLGPNQVFEYTQDVVLTIRYKDGDGDLGENNAGVKNCFVTDNRIGTVSSYRIQQLSPDGSSIPISGTLNIELGGMGITNGSTEQDVSFSIYVVDRAGNRSNTLNTSSIRIRKP